MRLYIIRVVIYSYLRQLHTQTLLHENIEVSSTSFVILREIFDKFLKQVKITPYILGMNHISIFIRSAS